MIKILWYVLGKRLYYLVTKPENIGYLKLICITKHKHYDQTQLLEKFGLFSNNTTGNPFFMVR